MSRIVFSLVVLSAGTTSAFAQFQHPSPLPEVMIVNDSFGKTNSNQSSYDLYEDQIIRLADFDGDGTFLGQLETSLLFEFGQSPNKNKSWQIMRVRSRLENGVPAVYFTNGRNGNAGASSNYVAQLYRGVDLDNNGFIDAAEAPLLMNLEQVLGGTQGAQDLSLTKNGKLWATTDFPGGGLVFLNGSTPIATVDFNTSAAFTVPGKNNVATQIDTDDFTTCTSYLDNGVLVYSDGYGTAKDEAIYSFRDLNGDGDARDPGEATCFLNPSGANIGLERNPDFGTLLPSITVSSSQKLYGWLKEMATMDELEHESYFFACNSSNSGTFATNEFGQYINGLIFRGVDVNGDRDLNDTGEVNLYYDGSGASGLATEFPKVLGVDAYQQSLVVFFLKGGSKGVSLLTDLNDDGDAMDVGERLDLWDELDASSLPYNLFLFGTAAGVLEPGILPEPTSRQATYSGTGCSQYSGPVPKITAQGDFKTGSLFFDVKVSGAAPLSTAYFFVGTGTKYFGQALPLPLAFLGLPGCTLYQDLSFQRSTLTDASGNAKIAFGGQLKMTGISGISFATQFITVDTSGPTPELAFSRLMTLKAP